MVSGSLTSRPRSCERLCPPREIACRGVQALVERGEDLEVERLLGVARLDHHRRQYVNRVAQRSHFQLHRYQAQLLDRARSAGVAVADKAHRLPVQLREDLVERVLQYRRVAVVVLGCDDEVAVRLLDLARPARHILWVFATTVGRRYFLIEERHRVVAQVDQLRLQVLASGESIHDPGGCLLAEASLASAAEDYLYVRSRIQDAATLAAVVSLLIES